MQSARHSRARKHGRAGGKYSTDLNKRAGEYAGDVHEAIQHAGDTSDIKYKLSKAIDKTQGRQRDSDGDGVPDSKDCEPLNPDKQGKFHDTIDKLKEARKRHIEKREMRVVEKIDEQHKKEARRRESQAHELHDLRLKRINLEGERRLKQSELKEKDKIKKEKEKLIKLEEDLKAHQKKGKLKEFMQKPSTKKALHKLGKGIKKELRRAF